MKKKINVGLLGHGFMGKAHSNALKDISSFFDMDVEPVMKVISGVGPGLPEFAEKFGWQNYDPDWENVVNDPEIDVIDIATPGYLHKDMAIAAAKNGKHIFCEKPISASLEEAKEMYGAVKKAGVKNIVDFNYRCVPAVRLAKRIIDEGKLGRIYSFKGFYLQDWGFPEDAPLAWRMEKQYVGPGPAEAGSHAVDMARYLVGEFAEVAAAMEIFVKERSLPGQKEVKKEVTSDDTYVFISRFKNGALGVFESSRMAAGRKNALSFEINGSKGSLKFELERLNELDVFFNDDPDYLQGFRNIIVTQLSHEYIKNWWPSGHIIGWEHLFIHQYYEFFKAISEDYLPSPNFYDGMKTQEIIEALARADSEKRWISIE
jgi:predicted dehydrogenase